MNIYIYFKKLGFILIVALVLAGSTLPITAEAAAVNTATNINVVPGTQYTTFKGVPVYRLRVTNAGDASDTITSLSPTPVGNVNDTVITLHFFQDTNTNGFVDQGDVNLGASAAFASDNTKQAFNITDVTVPALASRDILITADGLSVGNAQIFNLSFALGTDILMGTVAISNLGDFPFQNASSLTASDTAPSLSITNGSSDPGAKTATISETGVTVKQLTFTAAATSDSIVSLAITPAGSENDATQVSTTKFYIDNGTPGVIDGADILLEKLPTTYTGDNTMTVFTFSNPFQIASATSINILYTYDLGAGVVGGNTLTARLVATTDAVAGSGIIVSSNSSGVSSTITIADITAPTVTVTMDDDALNIGDTSLVTFTFSETPFNFTTADVTVANGSIGAIDASIALVQTAIYTPTNGITDATNVISVGTAWTDAALNTGGPDDSPNYTIDTVAPTVTVTMSDAVLTFGETSLVTFTFSETPVGFTTADVTVANGAIGAIDASTPLIQTATYTPTNGITDATNVISVGTDWTDAASNVGGSDDSPNYTIDTIASSGGSSGGSRRYYVPVPPLIDVVKVPSPLSLPGGSGPVKYTYTLRNIGMVPVNNITMVDDTCSPIILISGDTNADAKLDVNETWVHTCSTTLTKTHTNIVTTTGWANGISATDIANATVVVGLPVVPPLIHVTKIPSPLVLGARGGAVTYKYTVTNPGTVPLSDVSIADDKCTGLPGRVLGHPGDINKNNLLESNEAWSFTCKTSLTKTTTNIGIASGNANGLTAKDFAIVTVVVNATIPKLPNTGIAPKEKNDMWNIVELTGIIGALFLSFYLVRKNEVI